MQFCMTSSSVTVYVHILAYYALTPSIYMISTTCIRICMCVLLVSSGRNDLLDWNVGSCFEARHSQVVAVFQRDY